jgi:hypothetical protein
MLKFSLLVDGLDRKGIAAEIAAARGLFWRRRRCSCWNCLRCGCRWQRWHSLAITDDRDAIDDDGGSGFIAGVAFDARDGGYEQRRVRVAETEDGVFAVELGDGLFCDEELAAVGAAAGGTGAGVRHGEEAGLIEGEGGVDLILKEVAGVAGAVARAIAALDHELGYDAVEGGAVVEGLVVHLLEGFGIGPVFGAFGEADEVGYGDGCFFIEELAGEAAHGGIDNDGWAGGNGGRLELAGGAGGVGKLLGGWCRLCLRGYAEGENESESAKRHAVLDSNNQATADAQLEQCCGVDERGG